VPVYIKVLMFAGLTLLPVGLVITYSVWEKSHPGGISGEDTGYQEIFWQKLRELDYKNGQMTDDIRKLDGAKVAIPGFVVPLEDDGKGLSEFLLVPSPKACIHVPPPPPNQMVMVKMKSGTAPQRDWGPVWVKGTLRVTESESGFGKVSYLLYGEESEKYKAVKK